MPIVLTETGRIFQTSFPGTSLPADLTAVALIDGTVSVSGGACSIVRQGGATYVVGQPLPADLVFVMRAKARINSVPTPDMLLTIFDAATQPALELGTRGPVIDSYNTGVSYVEWANGPYTALNGATSVAQDYIWEFESDGTNLTVRIRDASTLAEIGAATKAWGSAEAPSPVDSLWPILGSTGVALWGVDLTAAAFEIFLSHEVAITGLATGNAARIYDAADDSVLASAVETAGVATLDCATVDWDGLTAYIKVFEDDTYAAELADSGEIQPCGGAVAAFSLDPPTLASVDPAIGYNDEVTSVTVTGTEFRSGAVLALELAGESDIAATNVVVSSSTEITCDFDLTGVEVGAWDLYVENTDATSDTLAEAFNVGYPVPSIMAVSPSPAYRGGTLTITGDNFGAVQGASTLTIGGAEVTVDSWSDNTIVLTLGSSASSGVLELTTLGGSDTNAVAVEAFPRYSSLKLNELEVNDLTDYALRVNSWRPTPASLKQEFADSPLADYQKYVAELGKKNLVALPMEIRVRGANWYDLRDKVDALLMELRKDKVLVAMTRGGTTTYYDAFPPAEIESTYWDVEYQWANCAIVTCTLLGEERRSDWLDFWLVKLLGVNDSFELRSGNDFAGWAEAVTGTGSIVANTTDHLDGATSCKLITEDAADTVELVEASYLEVDETHHHNIKLSTYGNSGTTTLDLDVLCYDATNNLLDTLVILSAYDAPDAAWLDAVAAAGEPVLYPSTSGLSPRFPEGTAKCKRAIRHDTTVGTVSIDKMMFVDSEYIVGHEYESVMGICVPPGSYGGTASSLADMYLTNGYAPGPWNAQASGILTALFGVDFVDDTHGWAVGAAGKILFHNGSTWAEQASGISTILRAVSAYDSTHIWATGDDGVIRYSGNGTSWAAQTCAFSYPSIVTDGGMESWVTVASLRYWGSSGGYGSLARTTDRYAGSYAARLNLTAGTYDPPSFSITTKNAYFQPVVPTESYQVTWRVKPSSTDAHITGMVTAYFYDANKVATGMRTLWLDVGLASGYVYHTSTITAAHFPAGTAYMALNLEGSYSIGHAPAGTWVQYDGVTVTRITAPHIYGVHAISASNVIAVGEGGYIAKFNGTAWAQKTSGVSADLRAVHAVDATHIWAVGADGTILFSADGTTWTAQAVGLTTEDLFGIYAADASNVWICGSGGIIAYYNGTSWSIQVVGVDPSVIFYALGGYDSTHVWAVGSLGLLLYNSGTWAEQGSGTSKTLRGVAAAAADEIWAVGDDGVIVKGLEAVSVLGLTHAIVGQRETEYSDNWDPVVNALGDTQVDLYTRRGQAYRQVAATTEMDFTFRIDAHKGQFLLAMGLTFSGTTVYDKATIRCMIQDAAANLITSSYTTQEVDCGDPNTVWKDVVLLATRFNPFDIPSHYVSENANLANLYELIRVIAHASLGAVTMRVNYLALIPVPAVEVTNWSGNCLILESNSGRVLSSLDGTLSTAMVFSPSSTGEVPEFRMDPNGMNFTIALYSVDTGEVSLTPAANIKLRTRERYLL